MATVVMLLSNPYRPDPRVRREALALLAEGYTISLLAWDREGGSPTREIREGIAVRRIGPRCGYDNLVELMVKLPWAWLGMLRRLLGTPFHAVHCHDLDTLPVGLFLARLKGRPCIFDAHELYSAMVSGSAPPRIVRGLQWLERKLVPRTDLLLTANETFGRLYREMGAPRVVVVMNTPLHEDLAHPDPARIRERLGLENEAICLYVGMLERSRNLDNLMEAFASMAEGDPVLVLGGSGTLVDTVQARAAAAERIVFVGWIDAQEKASYLTAADIILLLDDPTYPINNLAVSTRLLEAVALGVPVVASEGTASAEVVQKEGVGISVAYDDVPGIRAAIHGLLSDERRRVVMVRNALRAAQERYNWDVMRERLLEAYDRLFD